jgi:hypothetical protein
VKIGPTFTQATSGREKSRTVANSGAIGGKDCGEEEDKLEIERATLTQIVKIDKKNG